MARGPERGLERLAQMEANGVVRASSHVAATRAELLRRANRFEDAARAYEQAIDEVRTAREKRHLGRRLEECRARQR